MSIVNCVNNQELKIKINEVDNGALELRSKNIVLIKPLDKHKGGLSLYVGAKDLLCRPIINDREVNANEVFISISYRLARQIYNAMRKMDETVQICQGKDNN